jgi:hypothetical protein
MKATDKTIDILKPNFKDTKEGEGSKKTAPVLRVAASPFFPFFGKQIVSWTINYSGPLFPARHFD